MLSNKQQDPINPLIVIMSCHKKSYLWSNLKKKINKNLIIFCGDPGLKSNYLYKDRILYLKCEDTYEHLPTKVYMMIIAILDINEFSSITHIFKLDDYDTKFDNTLINKIKHLKITGKNYCGQKVHYCPFNYDTKYHYNKCSKTSIWYNKEYKGNYVSWCDGGCGYLLTRHSMKLIKNSLSKENIYKNHIYEDVMIALTLYKNNIQPTKIYNIIGGDK